MATAEPAILKLAGDRRLKTEDTEASMKIAAFLALGLALTAAPATAQSKPVLLVQTFTTAPDVTLPYDLKLLQTQLVPELKVMLGKDLEVAAEAPASGTVYTLNGEITRWQAGNVAKRLLVGLGSGREAMDLAYSVTDASGKKVVEKKDTIRTNFYSQTGSSGTLAHPIAQKIADRVKDARLR